MQAIHIVEAGQLKKDRGAPRIDKIQVMKRATVRRSKLYYLRDLAGKAARLKEKRIAVVPASSESE